MEMLLVPLIFVGFFIGMVALVLFLLHNSPETDYINVRDSTDININISLPYDRMVEHVNSLKNALVYQQAFTFDLEGQTYVLPYKAWKDADLRYRFNHNPDTGELELSLIFVAGIGLTSTASRLNYEQYKTLIEQLAGSLETNNDLRCTIGKEEIYVPFDILQNGSHRFEYEYERKTSRREQYELDLHIRSKR